MSCDPDLITCQISRLVEASSGWDWAAFAATLLATVVGGGLGLFGVWLGFRWQRKHRYEEVLNDCVVRVLEQIAVHATELRQFQQQRELVAEYREKGANFFKRTGEMPLSEPADFTMSTTLDIAQMRARGEDQLIITEAIRVHDNIRTVENIPYRLQMLGLLGGALSRWRSTIWAPERVRASLSRIEAYAEPNDVEVPVDDEP